MLPHPHDICRLAHSKFMIANTTADLRKGFHEWLSKIDVHKYYTAGPMFLSSYEYLKGKNETKSTLQFFIRFENYKNDLNKMLKTLNITNIHDIPIINDSNNVLTMMKSTFQKLEMFRLLNATNIYDDNSIRWVNYQYEMDFSYFGYKMYFNQNTFRDIEKSQIVKFQTTDDESYAQ